MCDELVVLMFPRNVGKLNLENLGTVESRSRKLQFGMKYLPHSSHKPLALPADGTYKCRTKESCTQLGEERFQSLGVSYHGLVRNCLKLKIGAVTMYDAIAVPDELLVELVAPVAHDLVLVVLRVGVVERGEGRPLLGHGAQREVLFAARRGQPGNVLVPGV